MSSTRESRTLQNRYRPEVEQLPDRIMPAYTASFSGGVITVLCDAANDNVYFHEAGNGNILLGGQTLQDSQGTVATVTNTSKIVVYGDGGNDVVQLLLGTYTGTSSLFGEDGNDTFYGAAGNDTMYGGAGTDSLQGNAGDDELCGQGGADTISGGMDDDTLKGGEENDNLFGGAGHDDIEGEGGRDTVRGDDGDDFLYGGDDKDDVYGGEGNDVVDGQDGDDRVQGGNGIDQIWGGPGKDGFMDDPDEFMDFRLVPDGDYEIIIWA